MASSKLLEHGLIDLDVPYVPWVTRSVMGTIQFSIDILDDGLQSWPCMWMILSLQVMKW
jgi:hypothetical protein